MADRRHSFFDTLTGFDPDEDDPLMRALDDLDTALDRLDGRVAELKKRSDPPPPLPPAAPARAAA